MIFGREAGRLRENMAFPEQLRRKSFAGSLPEVYCWKVHHGHKVNFVISNRPSVELLVQVTFVSGENEIGDKETNMPITASEASRHLYRCWRGNFPQE